MTELHSEPHFFRAPGLEHLVSHLRGGEISGREAFDWLDSFMWAVVRHAGGKLVMVPPRVDDLLREMLMFRDARGGLWKYPIAQCGSIPGPVDWIDRTYTQVTGEIAVESRVILQRAGFALDGDAYYRRPIVISFAE